MRHLANLPSLSLPYLSMSLERETSVNLIALFALKSSQSQSARLVTIYSVGVVTRKCFLAHI